MITFIPAAAAIRENTPVGTVVGTFSGGEPGERVFLSYQQALVYDNSVNLPSTHDVTVFKIEGNALILAEKLDYAKYEPDFFEYELYFSSADGQNVGYANFQVEDVLHDQGGTAQADSMNGDRGMDKLRGYGGDDILFGQRGNDILYGGAGADKLSGGFGNDVFLFKKVSESTLKSMDRISDFSHVRGAYGDTIDLSAIDANSKLSGNQAFTWLGAKEFTGVAGQLRYEEKDGVMYVYGDVNGDEKADFALSLRNLSKLYTDDFVF